ncbi:hypothetical protein N9L92_02240 [Saprospiraceae bacterium]|nr:hypothetical protein [Saprospiraceae bacterium]
MPTLQIRELPNEVYNWLKQRAKKHRRSMTKEATIVLEDVIRAEKEMIMSKRSQLFKRLEKLPTLDRESAELATKWIRKDRDRL